MTSFVDSHCHFMWLAKLRAQAIFVEKSDSVTEFLKHVKAKINHNVNGQSQLQGVFAYSNLILKEMPEEDFFSLCDTTFAEYKVFILKSCGHKAYVSPLLRRQLKINENFLKEQSLFSFLSEQKASEKDVFSQIEKLSSELRALGVREFFDMWVGDQSLDFYKKSICKNIISQIVSVSLDPKCRQVEKGPIVEPNFRAQHVKFFLDGSFSAKTAAIEEFNGQKNLIYSDQEIIDLVSLVVEKGFYSTFHAIGDLAVDQAIRLCDHFIQQSKWDSFKHRIEHLQCVRSDQIPLIKKQKWNIGLQPLHRLVDEKIINSLSMSPERRKDFHRLKSLESLDIYIGSDFPMADLNPVSNFTAMTTGLEAVSLEEASRLMNKTSVQV